MHKTRVAAAPAFGIAMAEMKGEDQGNLLHVDDALCRLLGRCATALSAFTFDDLVHPEDLHLLLRMPADSAKAEVRLSQRDGTYIWVTLTTSIITNGAHGPRYRLTHVEEINRRNSHVQPKTTAAVNYRFAMEQFTRSAGVGRT